MAALHKSHLAHPLYESNFCAVPLTPVDYLIAPASSNCYNQHRTKSTVQVAIPTVMGYCQVNLRRCDQTAHAAYSSEAHLRFSLPSSPLSSIFTFSTSPLFVFLEIGH